MYLFSHILLVIDHALLLDVAVPALTYFIVSNVCYLATAAVPGRHHMTFLISHFCVTASLKQTRTTFLISSHI